MSIRLSLVISLIGFFVLGATLISCDTNPYPKGKAIYDQYCISCHMADGTGLAALIPPLANSDYYQNNQNKIACIILYGQMDSISVNGKIYNQKMEGISMSEIQITNLINYINTAWGNNIKIKTLKEVEEDISNCNQ
jgi:mono/diheme cytochrome c family protein